MKPRIEAQIVAHAPKARLSSGESSLVDTLSAVNMITKYTSMYRI